jgi:hypothetical protein
MDYAVSSTDRLSFCLPPSQGGDEEADEACLAHSGEGGVGLHDVHLVRSHTCSLQHNNHGRNVVCLISPLVGCRTQMMAYPEAPSCKALMFVAAFVCVDSLPYEYKHLIT